MNKKKIYCMIVCLSVMLPISAQYSQNQVAILDSDAATSVFSVEGFGKGEEEAMDNACKATLYKLLYEGVEGFNDNAPIVSSPKFQLTNLWLKNFFEGKNPTYRMYIGGVEFLGKTSTVHCNVVIKHNILFRDATMNGLVQKSNQPVQQFDSQTQEKKSTTEPKKKKGFL